MKLAIVSDLHVGKKQYRTDENNYNKYEQIGYRALRDYLNIIKKEKPDLVINAGDTFETANPSVLAMTNYFNFMRQLEKFPTMTILGNHDFNFANRRSGCSAVGMIEHTYFADYSGNFNVSYKDLFYNENFKSLCPKADFFVTNNVVNQIISAQGNLWQQIQNNQNMQQYNYMNYFFQIQLKQLIQEGNKLNLDLNMFSFFPLSRWTNYLSSNKIDINSDTYAYMLDEIIQNLLMTNFNIDSILGTGCYKILDTLYKNNY